MPLGSTVWEGRERSKRANAEDTRATQRSDVSQITRPDEAELRAGGRAVAGSGDCGFYGGRAPRPLGRSPLHAATNRPSENYHLLNFHEVSKTNIHKHLDS